jgi:serine/threonine protein kinase
MAYCSAEIIKGATHTHSTDVWSLGVVLHILLSGAVPFLATDKTQYKQNIVHGRLKLTHPGFDSVSKEAKHLLAQMLTAAESDRISAEWVALHPWLK